MAQIVEMISLELKNRKKDNVALHGKEFLLFFWQGGNLVKSDDTEDVIRSILTAVGVNVLLKST